MGWASRPPVDKGGQDARPTRWDNLFIETSWLLLSIFLLFR